MGGVVCQGMAGQGAVGAGQRIVVVGGSLQRGWDWGRGQGQHWDWGIKQGKELGGSKGTVFIRVRIGVAKER